MHPAKKFPRDFQWQGMILRWAKSVGVHTRLLDDRLPLVDSALRCLASASGVAARAGAAAARVGYESNSQFSREYKRFFGSTPTDQASRFREGQLHIIEG